MRAIVGVGAALAVTLAASAARAEKPWIERPLALGTLHARIEAGVGLGQYTGVDATTGALLGQKFGTGSNLEAALGLPFFGEVSVRTGYRFGNPGALAGADYYARLFDHEGGLGPSVVGNDPWANPEIRLRGALVDLKVFAIGLESRFIVPIANNTDFAVAPGVPMMIRIPTIARIDTGVFLPIAFTDKTQYTISIPAQLWFQVENFFFGPMTGVRYNRVMETTIDTSGVKQTTTTGRTDIPAGIGAGYTLGGMLDVKAQLYTLRINDSDWSKFLGGGIGVALLVP